MSMSVSMCMWMRIRCTRALAMFVFSCCSKQAENTFVCLALDSADATLQVDRQMEMREMC